jgi:hypothetical protein
MSLDLATIGVNIAAVAGEAAIASITGIAKSSGGEAWNDILQSLTTPTLCYVPISCDSIEETNEADIANTMIIAQDVIQKKYLTDNVAPKPRTWDIHGYITALLPIVEDRLLIKPTLLTQRIILNNALRSRNTVPFKTDTGEIVDVVITRLKMKSLSNAQNAYEVSATVQEVEVLETTTNDVLQLDDIAKESTPLTVVKNLGTCSIVAGTVSAAALVGSLVK